MRRFAAIVVTLALALASVQAPVAHSHEHESTQQHPGGWFHTHVGHREASSEHQAKFRDFDPDDDAHFQQWFCATSIDTGYAQVVLTSVVAMPTTQFAEWLQTEMRPSAHDPPQSDASPPRAPPV